MVYNYGLWIQNMLCKIYQVKRFQHIKVFHFLHLQSLKEFEDKIFSNLLEKNTNLGCASTSWILPSFHLKPTLLFKDYYNYAKGYNTFIYVHTYLIRYVCTYLIYLYIFWGLVVFLVVILVVFSSCTGEEVWEYQNPHQRHTTAWSIYRVFIKYCVFFRRF